ncbi:transglutaminase domain-containing protein [Streptomyces sp. JJ38]|uniref:transglutaminase domain-containing protein n=1 Tax=Streptomyces sp. JJ38 TaxID=2738128 RepID=UPI001C56D75F|nr:transglutaminase domain-containing protein [Streptomyces sp. JJ38]MBW1596240.1 transglutaminase [Streptomyces sp. JJ38]
MDLVPVAAPAAYLAACPAVDHHHPVVRDVAARLRADVSPGSRPRSGRGHPRDAVAFASAAFHHVRDRVRHSMDSGEEHVTWRASDVLARSTGICYAKAHALAALLRSQGLPAALCYQRLEVVHGLVAVRLPGRPWLRLDPRGDGPGVVSRFSPDEEHLPYTPARELGEYDDPRLYAEPHPVPLAVLRRARSRTELETMLPREL